MKKTYIVPALEEVLADTNVILCASGLADQLDASTEIIEDAEMLAPPAPDVVEEVIAPAIGTE